MNGVGLFFLAWRANQYATLTYSFLGGLVHYFSIPTLAIGYSSSSRGKANSRIVKHIYDFFHG